MSCSLSECTRGARRTLSYLPVEEKSIAAFPGSACDRLSTLPVEEKTMSGLPQCQSLLWGQRLPSLIPALPCQRKGFPKSPQTLLKCLCGELLQKRRHQKVHSRPDTSAQTYRSQGVSMTLANPTPIHPTCCARIWQRPKRI